jgi:tRNA threonylcarbamoyl adenosine modification protein YeaZ
MNPSAPPSRVLAIDSGSPLVSVAFGTADGPLASRSMAIAHSSEALLQSVDEVLAEAGATARDIEGLVGLRGPGSFTGLRVGLATLLGLHQALGVPAVALPTLEVLSLAAAGGEPLLAVVDALRGEWFAQLFAGGEPAGPARIVAAAALADLGACRLVGHGVEALRPVLPRQLELVPAGELAPLALAMAARRRIDWSPATLLDPLYLRPAAIDGR